LTPSLTKAFARWWRREFGSPVPVEGLRRIYGPLARWILLEKARRRPRGLYVFGITGTIGGGKTTLARILEFLLNRLAPADPGRALRLSLDDYYRPKAARSRPAFRRRGYRAPGLSNRGPAGTHDVALLWKHLQAMGRRRARGILRLPSFDKQKDDRRAEPRIVRGPVGVVLLEGWFLGCRTDPPLQRMSTPLRRSVARALPAYRKLFDRLDALWAFDPPSMREIMANRLRQERALFPRTGRRGMNPREIRRFVRYFYRDAWEPGASAPEPDPGRVTFRAAMTRGFRIHRLRPAIKRWKLR